VKGELVSSGSNGLPPTLPYYDQACQALAKAKVLDEAKEIRDRAEAMRAYARQSQNTQLEADAFEVRKRAERRLGELIAEEKEQRGLASGGEHGGRKKKDGSRAEPSNTRPTLRSAGITKDLSSRAQKKAKLPPQEAERLIEKGRQNIIKGRPARNILQARREEEREERIQLDLKVPELGREADGCGIDHPKLCEEARTFLARHCGGG
jgi:hypothetical protein